MRSRGAGWAIGGAIVLALVSLSSGSAERDGRLPHDGIALEIVNVPGCPVQIIERRSRVTSTLDRGVWALGRRPDGGASDGRKLGPGEYQLAFDVAFKNEGEQEVVAVAFLWEALDASGDRIYQRIGVFGARPLAPGEPRLGHEVAIDPAEGAGRYRVSVYRVQLVDGESWAPREAIENGSAP